MRSQLYLFASGLFNQPTSAGLESLRYLWTELVAKKPVDVPWGQSLVALKPLLKDDEAMGVEYSRLFILATPRVLAQPYGSYWLEEDQRLWGNTTVEIKEMMAQQGIMVNNQSGLLPDHIVSELEFMAYLASFNETTSWQTQQQLLQHHLARWVPSFTKALKAAHPAPRYCLAAEFLEQLIDWDRNQLKDLPIHLKSFK